MTINKMISSTNSKLLSSIFFLLITFCEGGIVLPNMKGQNQNIQELLQRIITQTLETTDKILYASTLDQTNDALNNLYKVVYNYKLSHPQSGVGPPYNNYKPIDVYILEMDTLQPLEGLKSLLEWNPRAKFIIYYQPPNHDKDEDTVDDLRALFKYLASMYIYNVIIIVPDGSLYTYYPYLYENLRSIHLQPALVTDDNYFPEKVPPIWRNTTVHILAAAISPFAIDYNGILVAGTEYRLIEEVIKRAFKCKAKYIFVKQGVGVVLPNGTFTLLLGRLQNGEADFSIGGTQLIHKEEVIVFDVPHAFGDDDIIWAIPNPPLLSHTMNVTRIFTPVMWIALLSTLLLGSILWLLFTTLAVDELPYFKDAWHSTSMPLRFLFSELSAHQPHTASVKIVYCCTWIFVFIMNSAWEAHLIITLTYNNREVPIESLQDVIDRDLRIAAPVTIMHIYKNSNTILGKTLYDRNIMIPENNDAVAMEMIRAAYKKDTMSVTTRCIFEMLLSLGKWDDEYGVPGLRIIDEQIWHTYIVEYFVKGHPMFPKYNAMMNWLRASGLGGMYKEQLYHQNRVRRMVTGKTRFDSSALSIEHMTPAFVILVIGIIFSTLLFGFELIWQRYH